MWAVCQGAAQCSNSTAAGREVHPGKLSRSARRIPEEWPCWADTWLVLWLASHYRKLNYWLNSVRVVFWVSLLAKWWQRESGQPDFLWRVIGLIPGMQRQHQWWPRGGSKLSERAWVKINYAMNILEYLGQSCKLKWGWCLYDEGLIKQGKKNGQHGVLIRKDSTVVLISLILWCWQKQKI